MEPAEQRDLAVQKRALDVARGLRQALPRAAHVRRRALDLDLVRWAAVELDPFHGLEVVRQSRLRGSTFERAMLSTCH